MLSLLEKKKGKMRLTRAKIEASRGVSPPTRSMFWEEHSMSTVPLKVCTKCGESKPETPEFFNRDKSRKSGLRPDCKVCSSVCIKAWHDANREKEATRKKAWRTANPERCLAYAKAWRQRNPEKVAAYCKTWQSANPEQRAATSRNRRARKRAAKGTHTAEDVARQFNAQKGKCWWCGVKLKKSGKNKFHADHRIALVKGGSNGPENLVCTCPTCNLSKNAKSPLEFAGRLF